MRLARHYVGLPTTSVRNHFSDHDSAGVLLLLTVIAEDSYGYVNTQPNRANNTSFEL